MKAISLYSGGKIIREWATTNEPIFFPDGSVGFHTDPKCEHWVRITGVVVVENWEDKYGKAEE